MFFRLKTSGPRRYLQIVENRARAAPSASRSSPPSGASTSSPPAAASPPCSPRGPGSASRSCCCRRSTSRSTRPAAADTADRAPLAFGRLWQETGCRAVIEELLAGRGFEFAVERAVFTAVLHRLLASGWDRACEKWMADYPIAGATDLELHHLYRAMAWLGEELPGEEQRRASTPFAPRMPRTRSRRGVRPPAGPVQRPQLVFFDTTSLYFEGEGGQDLGPEATARTIAPTCTRWSWAWCSMERAADLL